MPRMLLFRSPVALLHALRRESRGATAVEYGLIVAVIALSISAGLSQITAALASCFDTIASYLLVTR